MPNTQPCPSCGTLTDAEREAEVYRLCRALAGSWLYGGWKAETVSERDQEAAMRALGWWPITEECLVSSPPPAERTVGEATHRERVRAAEKFHRDRRLSPDEEESKRWGGLRVTDVRQKHWNGVNAFASRLLAERDKAEATVTERDATIAKLTALARDAIRWGRQIAAGVQPDARPLYDQLRKFDSRLAEITGGDNGE